MVAAREGVGAGAVAVPAAVDPVDAVAGLLPEDECLATTAIARTATTATAPTSAVFARVDAPVPPLLLWRAECRVRGLLPGAITLQTGRARGRMPAVVWGANGTSLIIRDRMRWKRQ